MADQKIKPWQIAVLVLGVGGAIFAAAWTLMHGDGMPTQSKQVYLADIKTGELFLMSTSSRPAVIPERNPDTGALTLIPVTKNSQNTWTISKRYLDEFVKTEANKDIVDTGSGAVKLKSESARSIKP